MLPRQENFRMARAGPRTPAGMRPRRFCLPVTFSADIKRAPLISGASLHRRAARRE